MCPCWANSNVGRYTHGIQLHGDTTRVDRGQQGDIGVRTPKELNLRERRGEPLHAQNAIKQDCLYQHGGNYHACE